VQGKAEIVTDILPLLQDFYKDKLAVLLRHVAGARLVGQYDANNTYQYIINREETQLSWIGQAIVDLGGEVATTGAEPERQGGKGPEVARRVSEEDVRDAQEFYDRWRPRVEAMTNARHRGMLRIVLGETLEQKRFFEQALAGDVNLLGTRTAAAGVRVGSVMSTRWIE
jgi:hypothetical protein